MMKTLNLIAVAAATGISLSGAAMETLVILPLGDSITQGAGAAGGYRAPLHTLLTNAGYGIRFVGSATNTFTSGLVAASNAAHEGHGGYTTTSLRANLDANSGASGNNGGFWITGISGVRPAIHPDVILLMAGVNDLGVAELSPAQGLAGLEALIDELVALRPTARIVVSTLTPYIGTNYPNREANQQIFNAALPGVVSNRQLAGQRITLCDVRSGVPLTNAAALLTGDGVHPNQAGYNAIAQVWFDALQQLPLTNAAPSYSGSPTRQATITFPAYNRAETLTGFPALVVLGLGVPGFDYGTFASTNGGDLSFWSADGTNVLPYEIERWDTNGDSHVWVRLPALTNGTTILARWGDPLATNLPASTEVWADGYRGVWHFASSNVTDSSALAHDAVSNSAVPGAGVVASGATFAGSNVVQVSYATDLDLPTNFEVHGWFKVAASNKPAANSYLVLTSKQVDFNNRNWWLAIRSDGRLWWKSSPSLDVTNATDLCDGAWHFVAAVHDGTVAQLYIDGVQAATDTSPGTAETQAAPLYLGAEANIRQFIGTLDEFRLSAQGRSSNWVWASWLNLASNATFATVGPVTNLFTGFDAYVQQIPDAGLRGPQADADSDGIANLLEYVTGGNPTNADALANLGATQTNGLLRLQFTRNTNSADATIVVEGADGLTNNTTWFGIATNLGGSWGGATNAAETGAGATVSVSVQDNAPRVTNRFMRLRVTRP